MIPDFAPNPAKQLSSESKTGRISPAKAEKILEEALESYLADGWHIVERAPHSARLIQGMQDLEVHINAAGQVEQHTQHAANALSPRKNGRLVAWMVLLATWLVMLLLAVVLGLL